MYLVDYLVPWLGKLVHHHISGEIWFQLVSSWLLALPSIGICAYAVLQTARYRKLDDERLRPELIMKSAEISMCMVNWGGFDHWAETNDEIGVKQQEEYEQYRQRHSRENEDNNRNLGYLVLRADLLLKSGESVTRIMISEMRVQIGDHQYHMRYVDAAQSDSKAGVHIFFDRSYNNGQEEYHIEWRPDYENVDAKEEEKFWNDMYSAVMDMEYDITKKSMEWTIFLNIEYGMNKSQGKRESVSAEWKIRWSGDKRESVNDYMSMQCSEKGILSVG